ncbi:MAG TPA: hypothetical protein DCS19_04150 [Flavobacterium sp.]|nr:hypothetical protein [Flavobacterium sp.]
MEIKLKYNGIEHLATVKAPTGAARDAFKKQQKLLANKMESLKKSLESQEFDLMYDSPIAQEKAKYIAEAVERYSERFPENSFNKIIIGNVRTEAAQQFSLKLRATNMDEYRNLIAYEEKVQNLLTLALDEQEQIQLEVSCEIYKAIFQNSTIPIFDWQSNDFWLEQDVNLLKEGLQFFRRSIGD